MDVGVASWIIRISVGAVMVLFGLNQIVKPGAWLGYIPKWMRLLLPTRPETFMRAHGIGNLALGALLLSGVWPEPATWVVIVWWVSILPFALRYDLYIGLRDGAIIGALVANLFLLD